MIKLLILEVILSLFKLMRHKKIISIICIRISPLKNTFSRLKIQLLLLKKPTFSFNRKCLNTFCHFHRKTFLSIKILFTFLLENPYSFPQNKAYGEFITLIYIMLHLFDWFLIKNALVQNREKTLFLDMMANFRKGVI